MTKISRENMQSRTQFRHLFRRFCAGILRVKDDPIAALPLAALPLAAALVWAFRGVLFALDGLGLFAPAAESVLRITLLFCLILTEPALLVWLGTPKGSVRAGDSMQKAGLTNHAGEIPVLVSQKPDAENPRLMILEFDASGIPLSQWEDRQAELEASMNILISKMKWGEERRTILIYAAPADRDLPDLCLWKDEYLSPESFVLLLGEGILGPVTVNLAAVPHVLLGGATGSGKSVLLKLLVLQAHQKGAEVYIADFKGGVDFPDTVFGCCHLCFEESALLDILTRLVEELERRKKLFREARVMGLDAYNKVAGASLPRYVFACDEVAELFDKTNRSKEDKERLEGISGKLSTIARQGRAFGVHLILATQRPDANILPGQIKNNLNLRVCGRADNVLSQIILDNTSAVDQIPPDAQGRFITNDGTVFQAYYRDFDKEVDLLSDFTFVDLPDLKVCHNV